MTSAQPDTSPHPDRLILCPRYLWPSAWRILTDRRAAFATGTTRHAPHASGTIEVLVTRAGAALLDRLGLEVAGPARDPWPAARLRPNGARIPWRELRDDSELPAPPADWTDDPVADRVVAALGGAS